MSGGIKKIKCIKCYTLLKTKHEYNMKKVKMLKKLIERMEDLKDRPSDAFKNAYNIRLDSAISLIEDKIKAIESAEDDF